MHTRFPRYALRALAWVGLLWLPEAVLTTLARRGVQATLIASPEDMHDFAARGGRAALDRLQSTAQPPRLIATPTGDHSANHPAILAAIRNAVLPALAVSPAEVAAWARDTSASMGDQVGGEVFFVSADTARGS
jgi:hypothetical protein